MNRKPVPSEAQTEVILKSRRRCCICFGLDRETKLQSGQIAHLDRNPNNNSPDNLAFLCLEHHDAYDSTTSQRKNFVIAEVKHYRGELITALDSAFGRPVSFGEASSSDELVGQYIRINQDSISAELLISQLLDGRIHISGAAFRGPNMHHGFLDFSAEIVEGSITHEQEFDDGDTYRIRMEFSDGLALVSDCNSPMFGFCVQFDGTYRKTGGFGRYNQLW